MTRSPDDPFAGWELFVARHGVGDVVAGRVTKLVPFGVFVTLLGDVPALLLTDARPATGSTVSARVMELDADRRRVRLAPA